jgi:hypothetical protein
MSRNNGKGLSLGLLTACGALAVMLAWGLQAPELARPLGGDPGPADIDVPELAEARFTMPGLEHYSELEQRPLFSETRRPPEPEVVAEAAPEPVLLGRRVTPLLIGVMITPERRSALLFDPDRQAVVTVVQGSSAAGWELEEVRADGVTLRQGAQTLGLALRDYAARADLQPEAAAPMQRSRRALRAPQRQPTTATMDVADNDENEEREPTNGDEVAP